MCPPTANKLGISSPARSAEKKGGRWRKTVDVSRTWTDFVTSSKARNVSLLSAAERTERGSTERGDLVDDRNALPVEREEETRSSIGIRWSRVRAGRKRDEMTKRGKSDKTYSSPVYVSVG
jgi:hypothetical protein